MDVCRFRSKARLVAIVDLVLSSMSLTLCVILLLGAVVLSSAPVEPNDQAIPIGQEATSKRMLVTFLWVLVVFTSIATIIQIVAAIKLLNATQLGKDPVNALKLSVFWRHVCIVFTGLLIFSMFVTALERGSSIFTLIQILLRVSAIYIVTQFMKELETAIASGILPMHCQPGTAPIIAGVAYAYIPPQQQQNPVNPDFNAAPPSYQEVVKEPPPFKE